MRKTTKSDLKIIQLLLEVMQMLRAHEPHEKILEYIESTKLIE